MTDYEKQAQKFLEDTNTTLTVEFKEHSKHFGDDKVERDRYTFQFKRGDRTYSGVFGQSTAKSITPEYRKEIKNQKKNLKKLEPTPYDILACLQKYDPGTFEEFCDTYGYDRDSRRAYAMWDAVTLEWVNVCMLWNDEEIERLREVE